MMSNKDCKLKSVIHITVYTFALLALTINVLFWILAQFISSVYSERLFGFSIKFTDAVDFQNMAITIPAWAYFMVAFVNVYSLIFLIYGLVAASRCQLNIPLLAVLAVVVSFISDTLWLIYYMRLDFLGEIISITLNVLALAFAKIVCIYKIRHDRLKITKRTINVIRCLVIAPLSAALSWGFIRLAYIVGLVMAVAADSLLLSLPLGDLLFTLVPLAAFSLFYLTFYLIEVCALQKALCYNWPPYVVNLVVLSALLATRYNEELILNWETVTILVVFIMVLVTSLVKFVLILVKLRKNCNPRMKKLRSRNELIMV